MPGAMEGRTSRGAIGRIAERLHCRAQGDDSLRHPEPSHSLARRAATGTTTLAVNCATELARLSKKPTIIIDLNPFRGRGGAVSGRPSRASRSSMRPTIYIGSTTQGSWVSWWRNTQSGLDILAGSDTVDRPNGQDAGALEELVQWLGRSYEFVVIDAGHLTNPCAEVAVNGSQTRSSWWRIPISPRSATTQRVADRMEHMGAGKDRVRILLNRTSEQHLIAPKQIEDAIGHPIHHAFLSDYTHRLRGTERRVCRWRSVTTRCSRHSSCSSPESSPVCPLPTRTPRPAVGAVRFSGCSSVLTAPSEHRSSRPVDLRRTDTDRIMAHINTRSHRPWLA